VTHSIAVRLILIVAVLTTVATSPPPSYAVTATDERTLAIGTTRISARANRSGVAAADRLTLDLELRTASPPKQNTVTIVPDDPAIAPETIVVSANFNERSYQLLAVCDRDRDCDAGVSVEIPDGSAVTVTATATLVRLGDSRFLFPSDRSFPSDATVDVGFQP